jgi:hypothetical protein
MQNVVLAKPAVLVLEQNGTGIIHLRKTKLLGRTSVEALCAKKTHAQQCQGAWKCLSDAMWLLQGAGTG